MSSLRLRDGCYFLRYRENGKQREISLSTVDEGFAKHIKNQFDTNELRNPKESCISKFGAALDSYLKETIPFKSPHRQVELRHYAHKLDPLRTKKLNSIDSSDIIVLFEGSYSTKMKIFQLIKNVYIYVKAKGISTPDPTYGIKVSGYYETKEARCFSVDELRKIFRIADRLTPEMADLYRLMYFTGLRRNEARSLRWEFVHFDSKVIILPAGVSKSKVRQIVKLSEEALELLSGLEQDSDSGYVFHNPNTKLPWDNRWISKRFGLILRTARFSGTGIGVHALRHTFISQLVMAGVDLRTVQHLARHSHYETTLRYSHLSQDHVSLAINRLPKL